MMCNYIRALFLLSLISFSTYQVIGSYVDEAGYLHEPFFLLPIGYFFLFLGIIFSVIQLLKK